MPRLGTKDFCGTYCPSAEEAIESAGLVALLYMQEQNLIVVDDINLCKLLKCEKALKQATSWLDIFEHLAVKLKSEFSHVSEEVTLLRGRVGCQTCRCHDLRT